MTLSGILAGVGIGGASGGAMLAVEVITGAAQVNLGEASAVCVAVASGVWWVSAKFTKIEDRLRWIEDRLSSSMDGINSKSKNE